MITLVTTLSLLYCRVCSLQHSDKLLRKGWPLYSLVCGFTCVFVSGQVWDLIVSIPDLCLLFFSLWCKGKLVRLGVFLSWPWVFVGHMPFYWLVIYICWNIRAICFISCQMRWLTKLVRNLKISLKCHPTIPVCTSRQLTWPHLHFWIFFRNDMAPPSYLDIL